VKLAASPLSVVKGMKEPIKRVRQEDSDALTILQMAKVQSNYKASLITQVLVV